MRSYTLAKLYNQFLKETALITEQFEAPLPIDTLFEGSCRKVHEFCMEMCVIRLFDSWARFCRELVFLSSYCNPVTMSGNILPRAPKVRNRNDVIPVLIGTYPRGKPPNWEPRWGIPTECIEAANKLKLANFKEISAGLGATPSPVDDLRIVRNFFAHRGQNTKQRVQNIILNLGLSKTISLIDLLHYLFPPGVSLFNIWILELRKLARAAVF